MTDSLYIFDTEDGAHWVINETRMTAHREHRTADGEKVTSIYRIRTIVGVPLDGAGYRYDFVNTDGFKVTTGPIQNGEVALA